MKLKCIMALLLGLGFVTCDVLAQQQGGFNFAARAREALAQPYTGITSSGSLRSGLYEIKKTGVSTTPVLDAARDFLASLSKDQRKQILFPVDDPEWRNWANVHRFQRQGVSLEEMNDKQRKNAYALLRASLSAKGYQTSRDIMRLNHHLAELVSNFDEYGEHLYWFTIMGDPSVSEPWGWQIDGHHLIINYFVIGDQVVMSPTFMGSEPVKATSGKYTGVSILGNEQDLGLEFMQSLPPNQQQAALIGAKEGRSENLAEMFRDNITLPFAGLAADGLSKAHRDKLMELIHLYVGNINNDHSKIKLDEVRAHLDETYFTWKGDMGADAVFYYRIQSPVILIEFDHQGPIALAGSRKIPTRHHIHTVVRTPNGNDYGKSLLQQHYDMFKNDSEHGHTTK